MTKKKEVTIDYILIGIFTFILGILVAFIYFDEPNIDFLVEGQYAPKYIDYNHTEMLKECEKHNLIYNYEDAVCYHNRIDKLHEMEMEND